MRRPLVPCCRFDNYCYFSFGRFFFGEGLRAWPGDRRGSSTRASPVLSGGSTLSVARVLVQTALPRESCSTLPVGPFCCRLKFGRRIFTVSTMPNAPYAARYSPVEPKTQILHCPPIWSQNALCTLSMTHGPVKVSALRGKTSADRLPCSCRYRINSFCVGAFLTAPSGMPESKVTSLPSRLTARASRYMPVSCPSCVIGQHAQPSRACFAGTRALVAE